MNAYSVNVQLLNNDCLIALKTLADNSVDSVVTDPPYGLNFMGKEWDRLGDTSADFTNLDKPHISQESFPMKKSRGRPICETNGKAQQEWHLMWAKECLRVLKPGGFLLAFGGSRTYHRMACAIEDAGFEIRDQIMWVYGSGFPKSLNIGKAVDKLQGNKREVVGKSNINIYKGNGNSNFTCAENATNKEMGYEKSDITKGTSEWEGWGTALKPAHEPICMARKPLSEKTVVENVLKWGVGGINIDGCRVGIEERTYKGMSVNKPEVGTFRDDNWQPKDIEVTVNGRFPANFITDGSEEVLELFPQSSGCQPHKINSKNDKYDGWGSITNKNGEMVGYEGKGSAARFFYCAKASSKERNSGLEEMSDKPAFNYGSIKKSVGRHGENTPRKNHHPTVKPINLMRYLITLVTPKKGIVLDPFLGSGTTALACIDCKNDFIGIEKNKEYFEIAKERIERRNNEFRKNAS